jgi:hypothetical protein
MMPEQYPRPELTDDQRQELAAAWEEFESSLEHEDGAYFMECGLLEIAIHELVRDKVSPGDGHLYEKSAGREILKAKAKMVLEMGARHIMEGRPSESFLKFVAYSIMRMLNGNEVSLDHAFRLKSPAHRPESDPYTETAIKVALEHIHAQLRAGVSFEIARNEAIDKTYVIRWGKTPQEHATDGVDAESIRNRKRSFGKKLESLGY